MDPASIRPPTPPASTADMAQPSLTKYDVRPDWNLDG